ncbi:MAG: polyprenyl synthetase family protein [Candidatus Omnitrophota bacterium]
MLDRLRKDIDEDLRLFLGDMKKEYGLHRVSPLLFKGLKDFFLRKGKRIRPALFIAGYKGYTKRKNVPYKKLVRSSLALELLHNFMLVHDDVIDKSDLRRGKPTLHRFFNRSLSFPGGNELGSGLSIAAGDIIFAMAVNVFLSLDENPSRKEKALKKFIETAMFTGSGEFIDIIGGTQKIEKISQKDVFRIYTLKTAKYTFEGPMLVGAMLAGADQKELEKLSRMGIALGQAFQIQDDLLDMFASSKEIGKPVLSDLNESKKTLLVWKAYNSLKGKDKKQLKNFLEKSKKTHSDLVEFRKLVKRSGAHIYCLDKIESLLQEADSLCGELRMKSGSKKVLKKFVRDFFAKTGSLKKKIWK